MTKRTYMIWEIPAKYFGKAGEEAPHFDAPPDWDLFCLWAHPDGTTYGIFEKVTSL